MASTIRIDPRFRGPPASGNGGYSAGRLAAFLGGSNVEVTLRLPPPLGRDLQVERGGEGARLLDGGALIASAMPATVDIEVPTPPDLASAHEAERHYAGLMDHVFPGCFVCGPERAPGDGLRIFAGAVEGRCQVAAVWTPGADLADEHGQIWSEYLWAALDCPGYFAVKAQAGSAVLGRIATHIGDRPKAGKPLIVTGWAIGHDGRKHHCGTAIHDAAGGCLASARATWISLP
ncbi:hypothetical protein [Allosphingosinicella vermicomposti]|uniref:hypothetical protein n=1 Tax=Allosphingosinicella vermicomposti TaxID=614671 RepID=UPI000D0EAC4D|nr:hypothetical protein [Allosphingosinicella vermicomposti]